MIFYKNNQPIISIPTNNSLKIAWIAVGCFSDRTFIRKVFKITIYLRIVIHFLVKLFIKVDNKLDAVLIDWFEDVQKSFNDELYPVFIWSLVKGRKRYYAHLLDAEGNKCYFAKITEKKQDYIFLETEKKQLEYFANAKNFSTLAVESFTQNSKYCSLITCYLDTNFKLRHPDTYKFPIEAANEIAFKKSDVLYDCVVRYDWYQTGYARIKKVKKYCYFVDNINQQEIITVANTHGDFGGENILTNKGNLCIIDWESFNNNAPYLTDRIAYWLGGNHKNIKKNSCKTYKNFMLHFKNEQEKDIALALLFLISVNFDLAYILVEKWEK